jgi:hypothetical protein
MIATGKGRPLNEQNMHSPKQRTGSTAGRQKTRPGFTGTAGRKAPLQYQFDTFV